MKKNQVNAILYNQAKRRNTVFALISIIIIVSVITLSFFMIFFERSKKQYVSYDETSNIDYKIFLNDNEFFDSNYLDKNNRYIASLINYINASFNYKLSLNKEDIEYKYFYRIDADIKIVEKGTDNPLYNKTSILKTSDEKIGYSNEIIINENVNKHLEIKITYFIADLKKEGGKYINKTGKVKTLDLVNGYIKMIDNEKIYLDDITEIVIL